MQENPYQAPAADVADPASDRDLDRGQFNEQPQGHSAGAGVTWLGQAWELFKASPGMWIAMIIVLFALNMLLQQVPLLGNVAPGLLYPLLSAGLMIGCDALNRGQKLRFNHLFSAFGPRLVPLLVFAVLYFLAYTVASAGAMIPFLGVDGYWAFLNGDPSLVITSQFWLGALLSMIVSIPIMAAYWLAVPLIALDEIEPVKAIQLSLKGCLANIAPLVILVLLMVALSIATVFTLGLGLLVVIPIMFANMYTSYRAIFYR